MHAIEDSFREFNRDYDSNPLSLDEIKNGIKTALMNARHVAKLDKKDKKVHLQEIIAIAAKNILQPKSVANLEKKRIHAADLALENIASFIKDIVPQADVEKLTRKVLKEASKEKKSSECLKKGAEAVLAYICKNNRELRVFPEETAKNFLKKSSSSRSYGLANQACSMEPEGSYLFGIGEILLGGVLMITGGAIEIGSFGTLTLGFLAAETTGIALISHGLSVTTSSARNIRSNQYTWKNTNVYAPDRPLPMTPDGIPVPNTDAPHTQLGMKDSKRRPGEKYPQAREFDDKGNPIKTIDFTDHNEPLIHPNPHEHICNPNLTGGTPKRGDPAPLENWEY